MRIPMRKQKRAFDIIQENTIRVILKPESKERMVWKGPFTFANCQQIYNLLIEQLNPDERAKKESHKCDKCGM